MKEIPVGLLGFGTIGVGVVRVLKLNGTLISRRLGAKIKLAKVADVRRGPRPGAKLKPGVFTTDAFSVVDDPDIPVIIELIGGDTIARELVIRALKKGKHVVTANKELLAKHGEQLFKAAARSGAQLAFEASVGGAIPIIRSMREAFVATNFSSIFGIINGTSNFILSGMTAEGADFKEVLKKAQKLGYAEADPTFDIDGSDAAHKLAILVMLAYGTPVKFTSVYKEGITGLSPLDIEVARDFGYRIKLLAIAKSGGGKIEARVHPTLISSGHVLANVEGVHNAIFLEGEPMGEAMLFGHGAGMMPTAGAVVADVVEVARDMLAGSKPNRAPMRAWPEGEFRQVEIKDISHRFGAYYLRFNVLDRPGVLGKIAAILGRHQISIAQVLQKDRAKKGTATVFIFTHEAQEKNLVNAVNQIDRLKEVKGKTFFIRIEE